MFDILRFVKLHIAAVLVVQTSLAGGVTRLNQFDLEISELPLHRILNYIKEIDT